MMFTLSSLLKLDICFLNNPGFIIYSKSNFYSLNVLFKIEKTLKEEQIIVKLKSFSKFRFFSKLKGLL